MPRKSKTPMNPGRPDLDQQPISAPTGLPYGENKALTDAQQVAPLPQAPAPPSQEQIMAAAKAMPFPSGTLGDPTDRPNEPVTHGLASGPGAGPEVLSRPAGAPTVARTLGALASDSGDPGIMALAQLAESAGA